VALLYLDTSALVKLYVQEIGTERMLELAHPDANHRLAIVSLARLEFRAAVRRRSKFGDIDPAIADRLIHSFIEHLGSIFQVQPVNEAVLKEAAGVIDRHNLRAYDALQLGGYLALRSTASEAIETQFVCADEQLLEAARAEGVVVINPCTS
jgi:predicted nucleic acid-binding protein